MSDDIGNAKIFVAAAVAILAEYPTEVMNRLADPRSGTRVLQDYPSLSAIRKACDELLEPFIRDAERQAARKSHVAGLLRRPPRTAEQQARIDAQIARAKGEIAAAQLSSATSRPEAPA